MYLDTFHAVNYLVSRCFNIVTAEGKGIEVDVKAMFKFAMAKLAQT